jgi:DNA-binding transcriptional LysR family regulator
MDLNLLSLFVVVAECESFSTAADKLNLRRSSVSRSIAALERSLGVQLFARTTRHVALTTAGKALYGKVSPQLSALSDALGTLPEREEQPSGELRLTAPSDLGTWVLPELLSGFTLRYPQVQLDVRLTNRMVDLVAEGFDVALRASGAKLADSSLIARKLSDIEMQIYAAPEYLSRAGTPRSPDDLGEHRWVLMRGHRMPPTLPVPAKGHLHVLGDDILFILESVRAGIGLGMVPTYLAREHVAAGAMVRVLPRVCMGTGTLYLVHPPAQHIPRKVSAFSDFVTEHFAAHPLGSRSRAGLPRHADG